MTEALDILIVDDDQRMAKTLVDILTIKGYRAQAAHSGAEALEKIKAQAFDCVFSDVKMPGMNGVELHRAIREIRPETPVVLMTAYAADDLITCGLEEGVLAALTKPLDLNLILSFLSSLRKELTIVIVDDDPIFCRTLQGILGERGFEVMAMSDASQWNNAVDMDTGIVLLDLKLDHISGLDILRQIREQYLNLPVILMTGYKEEMAATINAAMPFNVHTFLYKPFKIDQLIQILAGIRRQELKAVFNELERNAP